MKKINILPFFLINVGFAFGQIRLIDSKDSRILFKDSNKVYFSTYNSASSSTINSYDESTQTVKVEAITNEIFRSSGENIGNYFVSEFTGNSDTANVSILNKTTFGINNLKIDSVSYSFKNQVIGKESKTGFIFVHNSFSCVSIVNYDFDINGIKNKWKSNVGYKFETVSKFQSHFVVTISNNNNLKIIEFDEDLNIVNMQDWALSLKYLSQNATINSIVYASDTAILFSYMDSLDHDVNSNIYETFKYLLYGKINYITSFFINNESLKARFITSLKNVAILSINNKLKLLNKNGQLSDLEDIDLKSNSIYKNYDFVANSRYITHYKPETGIELAYVNDFGKVVHCKEFASGKYSSTKINLYSTTESHFSIENDTLLFLLYDSLNRAYMAFANSNGEFFYYPFPIDSTNVVSQIIKTNSNYYLQYSIQYGVLNFSNKLVYARLSDFILAKNRVIPISPIPPRNFIEIMAKSPFPSRYSEYIDISMNEIKLNGDGSFLVWINQNSSAAKFYTALYNDSSYFRNGSNVVLSVNKNGYINWVSSFGDNPFSESNVLFCKTSPYIYAIVYQKYDLTFNDRLIKKLDTPALTLLKLDKNTGRLIDYKILYTSRYTDELMVDNMVEGANGQFYAAFTSVSRFSFDFAGKTVEAKIKPFNFLAKFDSNLTANWVKTTITPWTNIAGKTQVLAYDNKTNSLAMVQSQGNYTYLSSCLYQNWQYYFQNYTSNGEFISSNNLISSDLGGITTGTFTNNSRLLTYGFFRGKIEFKNKLFETEEDQYCYKNQLFTVIGNNDRKRSILDVNSKKGEEFNPEKVVYLNEHIYLLGTNDKKEIVLMKQNAYGKTLSYINLNQKADLFEYYRPMSFDVNDSLMVIGLANYADSFNLPSPESIEYYNNSWKAGFLKIPNSGWVSVENTHQAALVLFPNPCKDFINVKFDKSLNINVNYSIFDYTGKLINQGKSFVNSYLEINTEKLASGIYFGQISDGVNIHKIKFIVSR